MDIIESSKVEVGINKCPIHNCEMGKHFQQSVDIWDRAAVLRIWWTCPECVNEVTKEPAK